MVGGGGCVGCVDGIKVVVEMKDYSNSSCTINVEEVRY